MAGLIEQGADQLAGLAQALRDKDLRTMLRMSRLRQAATGLVHGRGYDAGICVDARRRDDGGDGYQNPGAPGREDSPIMAYEQRMSLRELVGGVAEDARDLVRGEVALARAEVEQKVDRVTAG